MTDADQSFMLELLKRIQADMADMKRDMTGIRVEIAAIGQQLGALTSAVYSGKSETDDLRRRIERIERRLEISDTAH
jgi:predicted  nucleic acid-binding Zn-ribbon protein